MVTYGNRHNFYNQVITKLIDIGVTNCILVHNGSKPNYHKEYTILDEVILDRNYGSSFGFHQGIKRALDYEKELIFLLDDDNLPSDECVDKLLTRISEEKDDAVFGALRDDRHNHKKALSKRINFLYPINGFLGFHMANKICPSKYSGNHMNEVNSDVLPYGGSLIKRDIINKIGLPNIELYLYGDDYEYFLRLREYNIPIYILGDAKIKDLESSWHVNVNGSIIFDTDYDMKTYYTIRNGVYSDCKSVNNKYVFILNAILYLTTQVLKSTLSLKFGYLKPRKVQLLLRAIYDGVKGNLGEKIDWA